MANGKLWSELFPSTWPKQQFKAGDMLRIRKEVRSEWYHTVYSREYGPWEARSISEVNEHGFDVWFVKGYSGPISEQWLEKVTECQWYGRNLGEHEWTSTADGGKRCIKCKETILAPKGSINWNEEY